MDTGPEDSINWFREVSGSGNVGADCVVCRNEIVKPHCPNSGCPWCVNCVANRLPKSKPRKGK